MHLQLFSVNCIFNPMVYDIIMEAEKARIVDMRQQTRNIHTRKQQPFRNQTVKLAGVFEIKCTRTGKSFGLACKI